jgi:hypothetical protein
VRGTVEETLNALLDVEADRMCNAERYERIELVSCWPWAESHVTAAAKDVATTLPIRTEIGGLRVVSRSAVGTRRSPHVTLKRGVYWGMGFFREPHEGFA